MFSIKQTQWKIKKKIFKNCIKLFKAEQSVNIVEGIVLKISCPIKVKILMKPQVNYACIIYKLENQKPSAYSCERETIHEVICLNEQNGAYYGIIYKKIPYMYFFLLVY